MDEGGHLVSIHSQEEQEFVEKYWFSSRDYVPNLVRMDYYSLVRKPFSLLYIGLHDSDHDGRFEWTDGSPVDFEHWLEGEPSGGYEDSVMLWDRHNNRNRGRWNDVISMTPRLYGPFMCKISPLKSE
ncbi:Low affinity immunoglobulin epsilon Fc receptor [Holothuria leucospilota]|uniref:Low affinity immunoglobulin epsilon Fc receptor n=1 Tax=Holothuria leucospilota TaxID=206669 RepID=A0A9Q1HHW4_HOLLE|nr:Low affinity immunoglobulin epsilon Fc receptor [Holothuria leucospilota]